MRARAIVGMVLVAAMAGCSSDTETPTAPAADGSISTSSSTSSTPTSSSASPSEEPLADVVMSNFFFDPDEITVTSGDDLSLFNASASSSHSFTVTGQSIDVIVELQTEASATIDLEAGTYPFVCKFHESAGMVGTLVVQPVAA
ncbi:MAG: cupredoxin domain-containing protein [Actinomycetota bacterium]